MKAFIVDRYGKKDGAWIGEMPDAELRQDDVLVRIHAAGVNLLDSKIRNGEFKLLLPYRLPLILGNNAAGVVVRVGSAVRRFKPGDGVYARPDKSVPCGSPAASVSLTQRSSKVLWADIA
jgi:NADPH:quinone reductase-like Zn-dependent oxidoreductase